MLLLSYNILILMEQDNLFVHYDNIYYTFFILLILLRRTSLPLVVDASSVLLSGHRCKWPASTIARITVGSMVHPCNLIQTILFNVATQLRVLKGTKMHHNLSRTKAHHDAKIQIVDNYKYCQVERTSA